MLTKTAGNWICSSFACAFSAQANERKKASVGSDFTA